MKTSLALSFLLAVQMAKAAPTTWSFDNAGNGHSYEVQVTVTPITWGAAKVAAEAAGGHLATITSAQENAFIASLVAASGETAHIGGYQPDDAAEPAEGWSWITGEPFNYTNWYATDREPSNTGPFGNEDRLQIYTNSFWNDIHNDNAYYKAYVIEYPLTTAVARPLASYFHSPADGVQAVKDFRLNHFNQCLFTFSTADTGRTCLVSWTENLRQWFPLIQFQTSSEGTEIIDTLRQPSQFYRTTFLPEGVLAAEGFDYPIGSGLVPEQITPEQNDLYPNAPIANPDRGSTSPGSGWYNVQDVGSYYATFGGLHGGEDWNKGSGTADVGEQVKVIANGEVIDIRPAHSAGASHSGYAVLVRHWLLNGDTVDSLYVHVAPDTSGGSANTDGVIGAEADFSFQEGSPVSKGDVIGVIGAVTSPAMSPHLHFEMRSKQTVPNDLWPNDTGDGYYGPVPGSAGNRSPSITAEEVQAAFLLMQKDGIIDPSDFIDQN